MKCHFIDAWRRIADDTSGSIYQQAWSKVRGIVSAAWAHLRQVRAEWTAPFRLRLLHSEVDLVTTPPRRVLDILRAHARWHFDLLMIERIIKIHGDAADLPDVLDTYRFGIDWDTWREVLSNKNGQLTALECRALLLTTTQALWPEDRRWRAGLLGQGTCMVCLSAIGTMRHKEHECEGTRQHLLWQRLSGRISAPSPLFNDPRLLPLTIFGLPPAKLQWQPLARSAREGGLEAGCTGTYFGDGSGTDQDSRTRRRATWAPYRSDGKIANNVHAVETEARVMPLAEFRRGAVHGWFATVPRSELRAAIEFLEVAGPGSTYYGDCKYVLEGVWSGVSWELRSSHIGDADLRRIVKRLMDGHASKSGMRFMKVKAHQSRQAAEDRGYTELQNWTGNARADALARQLARQVRSNAGTETTGQSTVDDSAAEFAALK